MKNKLNRVCDSLGATRYEVPRSRAEQKTKLAEVEALIQEQFQLEQLTRNALDQIFDTQVIHRDDSNCAFIEENTLIIMKEKAIYETMNLSKQQASGYSIDCWIPTKKSEEVMETINMKNLDRNKNKEIMGGQIRPYKGGEEKPPTYFKLNKFTAVFQLIVNIYGVPRYKEINPGLFTIVTFPFLFAVMFGDMLHGSLLLAFAAYLCLGYNYILKGKGMLADVLPFRYLVLLMGCFAVFTGMIYNDFTSLQMDFFGSCYEISSD